MNIYFLIYDYEALLSEIIRKYRISNFKQTGLLIWNSYSFCRSFYSCFFLQTQCSRLLKYSYFVVGRSTFLLCIFLPTIILFRKTQRRGSEQALLLLQGEARHHGEAPDPLRPRHQRPGPPATGKPLSDISQPPILSSNY